MSTIGAYPTSYPVPSTALSDASQLYLGCDITGFEKVDMVFDYHRPTLRLQFKSENEATNFEERLNFNSGGRGGAIFYKKENEKEKLYFGVPIFFESSDDLPPPQDFPFLINLLNSAIMEENTKEPLSSYTVSSGFDLLGVQQIFTTLFNNRPSLLLHCLSVTHCQNVVEKLNFNENGRLAGAFYRPSYLPKNNVIFSSVECEDSSIKPLRASFLFALLKTAVKETNIPIPVDSHASGPQLEKNDFREKKCRVVKKV